MKLHFKSVGSSPVPDHRGHFLRTLTDADGVVWTVIEDEELGGQPMQQHAAVFTAADGRRRWVPMARGGLKNLQDAELRSLLMTAPGTQAER